LDESGSSSMGGLEALEIGRSYVAQIGQGVRGGIRGGCMAERRIY
jgi:hypothetical protein